MKLALLRRATIKNTLHLESEPTKRASRRRAAIKNTMNK